MWELSTGMDTGEAAAEDRNAGLWPWGREVLVVPPADWPVLERPGCGPAGSEACKGPVLASGGRGKVMKMPWPIKQLLLWGSQFLPKRESKTHKRKIPENAAQHGFHDYPLLLNFCSHSLCTDFHVRQQHFPPHSQFCTLYFPFYYSPILQFLFHPFFLGKLLINPITAHNQLSTEEVLL